MMGFPMKDSNVAISTSQLVGKGNKSKSLYIPKDPFVCPKNPG